MEIRHAASTSQKNGMPYPTVTTVLCGSTATVGNSSALAVIGTVSPTDNKNIIRLIEVNAPYKTGGLQTVLKNHRASLEKPAAKGVKASRGRSSILQ
ncbi:hypothetical protein CERZMDRAFT_101843 [Cercospora zeae-maydis SCOH1-5]|uniref:Uncharacterized protein n=1 Tax=Cercospora zeae-maydis SCOH1-5 TaxID=717836 RepID=A0A6A6F2G8_9PEZI|nr:hypothetical protein CERZMDRAFT_101843 [Cercospora zeae-maydis SCOH1-5]